MATREIPFRFGKEDITVNCPEENIMAVVTPGEMPEAADESKLIRDALQNPIGTKRLSEIIGMAFVQQCPDLSFIALRLYGPVTEEQWSKLDAPRCCTAPNDLRRAFLSATALEHRGFDGVFIATDLEQQWMRLGKAERLLGWRPQGD